MKLILNIVVVIIAIWLIVSYLIPMLPYPISTVAIILVVIAAIVWLMKVSGLWF